MNGIQNPLQPQFLEELYRANQISSHTLSVEDCSTIAHTIADDVRAVLDLPSATPVPLAHKQRFWKINTVYCGSRSKETYLTALKKIGDIEGFSVELHPACSDWVRDSSYTLSDSNMLVPAYITEEQMFEIERASAKIVRLPPECKMWTHLGFLGSVTPKIDYIRLVAWSDMGFSPLPITFSDLYFQGGNILKAETRQGEKCTLIGVYNVLASHFLLKREVEEIKKLFEQTFAEKVAFCGITHLEQLSYHLDIAILPLMGAKVLIQDHDESVTLLRKLLDSPQVSPEEKQQFTLYLQDAQQLADLTRQKRLRLKQEMLEQGFEPISISGAYYIAGEGAVNYLNALHGYAKSKNSFVITFSYSTPGEKYLQGVFTHHLQQFGVERVYYVSSPIASSMLTDGGGLRCDTCDW